MKYERLVEGGSGAFRASNGNVYFLNGCLDEHECERYKANNDNWELVPSFRDITENESLNLYVRVLIRETTKKVL